MEFEELRNLIDDVRELVREVVREELTSLSPTDMPSYRILANRRQDLGKTQQDVARDLNVSLATVGSWETGRLPLKSADMYAAYLGLRIVVIEAGPKR